MLKKGESVPRIQLERYRGKQTKTTCPQCGKRNTFTKYVDVETGIYVGDEFGRCDREIKCGYHKPPSGNNLKDKSVYVDTNKVKKEYLEPDVFNYMDSVYVLKNLSNGKDNLSKFLFKHFDNENTKAILDRYYIGYSNMWNTATVFWQIDNQFRVRTGKVMLYSQVSGKRVKEPYNHINWMHTPDNRDWDTDFGLKQCFFGEHLLTTMDSDTIHVVESEKTAIICSIISPERTYVATGGLQNIGYKRLLPFRGRKLIFYPDKGEASLTWSNKLKNFTDEFDIVLNTSINNIEGLKEGDDLADYILIKNKIR